MNNIKNKFYAFTLAETLITLVIIGVVAALTVPNLINKYQKQENVQRLKKTYSTLAQVTNKIIAEEGTARADKGGWATNDNDRMYYLYKKHLINSKECKKEIGCFEQGGIKSLYGNNYNQNWHTNKNIYKLVLSDGTQIAFADFYNSCNGQGWGSKNMCAYINIDVNGAKKPNQFGRDNFVFVIKENGLYPMGCDDKNIACSNNDWGAGCACRVIQEGAINY